MDIIKYSLSHRTINEWNKLSNDYVNINIRRVNMLKNTIARYLTRAGYT